MVLIIKKTALRFLSVSAAVLFLLPCFASCSNSGTVQGSSTTAATSEVTTAAPVSTEPVLSIPDEDMGGYEFVIYEGSFPFNNFSGEFQYDESAMTVIDDAIYRRNAEVENKFKIKIVSVKVQCGSTTGSTEGYGVMMKQKTAGDTAYDAAVLPAYDQSLLAYSGCNYDLTKVPNLDLESSYWDQQSVNNLKIKDMLFFVTGDYSMDVFDASVVVAFNKDIAAKYEVNDLYELVQSGKWTIDKWMEYTSLISEDTDSDGFYTEKDSYGALLWDDAIYAVVNGAGELCCDIDDSGDLVLTIGTERTAAVFEKFVTFATETCCLRYQQTFGANGRRTDNSGSNNGRDMFQNGQGLFYMVNLGALSYFRNMDTDYGILPVFKYTEEQDRYYNTVAPYNARFLCVPVIQEDVARTGKVLEAIGFYSSKYITDAYYEKTLYGTVVRDDESRPMLELIRENRVFDLGYYYQPANVNKNLIYLFRAFNPNWAVTYAKFETAAKTKVDKINEAYDELIELWKEQ